LLHLHYLLILEFLLNIVELLLEVLLLLVGLLELVSDGLNLLLILLGPSLQLSNSSRKEGL
jgi:hypothetical protein